MPLVVPEIGEVELVKTTLCFGGKVQKWKHKSLVLGKECDEMVFSTFLPNGASANHKYPVIYWLSGLTCTDENFITKAAAQVRKLINISNSFFINLNYSIESCI